MYLVWAILPFVLLMMTIWAFLKPYFKVPGKESPMFFLEMFFFSAIIMAFSVYVAEQEFTANLFEKATFGFVTINTGGILIYPAFLLVAAKLSDRWDIKRDKNKRRRRTKNKF